MRFTMLILWLVFSNFSKAQTVIPEAEWKKSFGGSNNELHGVFAWVGQYFGRWADIDIDTSGIIYVATATQSSDVWVNGNRGDEDIWVIALNSTGDTLWTKTYGGSKSERVLRVRALNSGGCLIVGSTISEDGDFAANPSASFQAFVIRLDANGQELWRRLYGGTEIDHLTDVIETSDGALMACGESTSFNGDLLGAGNGLAWVIKLNRNDGSVIWSKTFEGPDAISPDYLENYFRLSMLSSNEVVLAGYTTPNFNDFNLDRINLAKINLNGDLVWSKKIGASGGGDYPAAIVPDKNGGFYLAARMAAIPGGADDASNYYGGGSDFWFVHLNGQGDILFEKNFGGSGLDVPYDLVMNDSMEFYMTGLTRSTTLDAVYPSFGNADYWLVKFKADGDTIYTLKFGGTQNDFASGMAFTPDFSTLYIAGGTESADEQVETNNGGRDLWVIRLNYPKDSIPEDTTGIRWKAPQMAARLYPQPSHGFVILESIHSGDYTLYDMQGKKLAEGRFGETSPQVLSLKSYQNGMYWLHLQPDDSTLSPMRHRVILHSKP